MIGIPYATVELDRNPDDGLLYTFRVCPVCEKRIGEDLDPDTYEIATNNYGKHYEAEHEGGSDA